MGKVRFEISMSLDGYVAGPSPSLEEPLGKGGEGLHEWVVRLASWRRQHGLEGGETGPDDDMLAESVANAGATIMGRRMFSGGEGPWEDDPRRDGWWGDEPPFHTPVFILTHHAREPQQMEGGTTFTFVTDGIEAALEQARAAAGDKDVAIAGGGSVGRQYLEAGLLDEMTIHLVPVLLGGGVSLFEGIDPTKVKLEPVRSDRLARGDAPGLPRRALTSAVRSRGTTMQTAGLHEVAERLAVPVELEAERPNRRELERRLRDLTDEIRAGRGTRRRAPALEEIGPRRKSIVAWPSASVTDRRTCASSRKVEPQPASRSSRVTPERRRDERRPERRRGLGRDSRSVQAATVSTDGTSVRTS